MTDPSYYISIDMLLGVTFPLESRTFSGRSNANRKVCPFVPAVLSYFGCSGVAPSNGQSTRRSGWPVVRRVRESVAREEYLGSSQPEEITIRIWSKWRWLSWALSPAFLT